MVSEEMKRNGVSWSCLVLAGCSCRLWDKWLFPSFLTFCLLVILSAFDGA